MGRMFVSLTCTASALFVTEWALVLISVCSALCVHSTDNFVHLQKNELFVGRIAMLGFASELVGEKLSGGKGPLGQLGLSLAPAAQGYEIVALGIWIGFFLVAAIGYGNYGEQEGAEVVY